MPIAVRRTASLRSPVAVRRTASLRSPMGWHPVRRSLSDGISDALEYWVPAFAGTTAEFAATSQPPSRLQLQPAHEVALADRHTAVAQDVVGGGGVEEEVRQRER